jgi:hypothetical protein
LSSTICSAHLSSSIINSFIYHSSTLNTQLSLRTVPSKLYTFLYSSSTLLCHLHLILSNICLHFLPAFHLYKVLFFCMQFHTLLVVY